jgi:NADP-reducing hydrogenase subunit HndB
MKTIEDLNKIRSEYKDKVNQGKDRKRPRIVVGMATCGIAAGAKFVLAAINDELEKLGIKDVDVVQTGCIGICRLEPVVEVIMPGEEKVTYVKMTAAMGRRMVNEQIKNKEAVDEFTMHIVNGKVLNDYTVI